MREIAINVAIGFGILILLVLSKGTIRYRVTSRFLRISWLGLPVRWVRLKNIRQILTQRVFWAEPWSNSFKHSNRYLLIRKHSGLFKSLVITPKNHMVFRADLERARSQLAPPEVPTAGTNPAGREGSHSAVSGDAVR